LKHILIKDIQLNGWEYGMLRSFESAIVEETGATTIDVPPYTFAAKYMRHFGQGMNRSIYRRYFPQQEFRPAGEVTWCILMGPENYRLDLYKGWQDRSGKKILYIYDTLPMQYPLIKRLFSDNTWDLLITSFNDSVDDLQQITGRKWLCVEQAADRDLFKPAAAEERIIHFSAYGRRYPRLHEALKEFCAEKGLYYDYTTHDGHHPIVDSPDLYRQYAWHVNHSLFNISWPVELTNPQRAGHLRPLTCRWFEAAAAATVIVGKSPANPAFASWLDEDLVVNLDPDGSREELLKQLNDIWDDRERLLTNALRIRAENVHRWTWNDRVRRILSLL
jgi:hypothetical protein